MKKSPLSLVISLLCLAALSLPARADVRTAVNRPPSVTERELPLGDKGRMKNAPGSQKKRLTEATLRSVWDRLSKETGFSAALALEEKEEANAYITREGEGYKIVVFRGLLSLLESEDELAGVVAHEIGHGVRGHIEEGAAKNAGIALAADLLSRLLGGGKATEIALGAGAVLASQGYSREQEVEADDFAVATLARSGYSPWGLYNAIRRMAEAGLVTSPSGFNSHPPTERRMTRLKAQAEHWEAQIRREGTP